MSKELPYFKFEPSQWDNGNIQMCSRESKGLFIELCSIYWTRLGELPYALALQKLCNGSKELMQELVTNDILAVKDGQIIIEFLDEQLSEFQDTSKKRAKAANKRWSDANEMHLQCKSNAIREEKIREEKIREEETKEHDVCFVWPSFEDFWIKYDKKVGKPKAELYWKKINQGGREKIMVHLDHYIQTEKQYRKDPERYLKNKTWEDEIILKQQANGTTKDKSTEHINSLMEGVKRRYSLASL